MNLPERPTALVIVDDIVAFGVLRGLNELGYKVPQDVSIISFNNISLSELSNPPLSSVDIGIYNLGYTASQALIQSIRNPNEKGRPSRYIIPHRLMIRESSMHSAPK